MASESRTTQPALADLLEALEENPQAFEFFYALRRLECQYDQQPRIGTARSPKEEKLRLGQDASMAFAPAALSSYEFHPVGARLGVAFLGLFGPNGPLPLHLTDYALARKRTHKDETFLAFADVFHHRFLSLFYRAWASAQPTVNFDRPEKDRFGDYVASLCGLGLPSLRNRDALEDRAKLWFAGSLQCVAKSPERLIAWIHSYFRLPVELTEFIGEWLEIPTSERCVLGNHPDTGTLGVSAIIGAQAFACQHRFRLHIGPMGLEEYMQFLPGGAALAALMSLVRNFLGDEYAWEVQLILRKEAVPPLHLGSAEARLGWTSWLGTRRTDRDADDLILDPLAFAEHRPREGTEN